jgi:tape measure domain-containing protein
MATQQKTTIVIEGDHSKATDALDKATDALDKVNKAVDKVKENVKELGKEFDKLEPAVNSIRNAATGLNQSATQVRQATAEFRNLDGTVRSATNSLGSMSRSATSSTSSLGSAGRSATQMATGMHSAVSATDILTRQLNNLNLAVAGSSSALGAFRNLMGTLGISIGAGQLAQYMDAWVNLAARLKLATNNTTELKVAQEAVVNISKESRMSLVDLADLYYKVGSSAKDMGINQTQVIKHVQAVANAILISGSSAESAKAALVQYSQAFASNRFGGDELRSVAEQAPRLFKAIREGLVLANGDIGATTAQMKQLAAEGFITSEKMNQAMANSAEKLAQEAKSMPITIGQAFTLLNNELVRFIGSEGQTSGAFTAIVNLIQTLANNVETLVRAMVVGTGAWLSYKAAVVATTVAEYASVAATESSNASKAAAKLVLAQTTAAEVANTEAQLANAVAAERIAITQAQRLAASGLMTNAVLANTAAVQANAVAQAEYTAASAISTGATTRLAIAFDTLTLGMMRNPFVALLVVLGAFATYLYTIRDSLTEVDGKMVSVGAIWQATWEDIGNKILNAKNYLANLIPDAVVSGWTSSINVLNQLLDKAGSYFGGSTNEPSDITKRAMAIDAKAKSEAQAKLEKEAAETASAKEAKSANFYDWSATAIDKTKSLPTERNYVKELEKINEDKLKGQEYFNKEQKRLSDEMLAAKIAGDMKTYEQDQKSIANNKKSYEDAIAAYVDQASQIQQKLDTIRSEATGSSAKKRDFEKAFRENLTKDIDAMINEQASLRGVEAAAVKALIATESRFKQGAVSETGAKTMFQFFDPAAKSVGTTVAEMLKSEALTIEKGTQYFAMMLKQSNGNVDQAIARYHDGTGKIQNKINAAGGKFEMSMVSPEVVDQINDFKIALDVAGSSVTQVGKVMRENYKEQEAAIKKQENAIKAIAKRGSPEEERLVEEKQLVDEYAKTVNADATLIADAYARIADAQQKLKDKKLDPFRDYTATAKELYASLQSGDITQSQFNLDIAKSKGTLANRTSETDVPVERQQDVIAFSKIVKDEEKATTAMKKFNDQMDKSTAAFDSFGHSGKMAFDGILGGISAVAAAASSFGTDLTKLNAMQTDSQKSYDTAMKQVGATEADKAKATEKYNTDKLAYNEAVTTAEISGMRSLAGATSKMFGEKSAARKAFHGIEMGLAVIEMAMSLKKTVVNIAEGASKMFATLGPFGFVAVAGMLAVMAGLGIAAGASDTVTDMTTPETSTTGSVLGSDGASSSIKNIVDTLNSIHASEYVELQGINSNFQNLTKLTTTSLALSLRDRGAFTYSADQFKGSGVSTMAMVTGYLVAGVVGVLGAMLLGVGKIKYEAVGGGIVINAQKLMLDGMEKQIEVMDYTTIKKTVKGWFSKSVTYFDVITGIDNPLTKLFRQVFSNVGTTLVQAATDSFKDTSLFNTDLIFPRIKLSLKAGENNNTENQKKIEDAINKASDDIASQAFGRYLAQFQQMSEGLYETTIRLAVQASVATAAMEKLGSKTSLTGLGLISFSDSMTRAFGGLKEFKAGIDSLYESFTSDPQKLIDSKKQVADFLVSLQAPASAGLPAEITSKADAAKVTDYLLTAAKNISAVTAPFLKTTNLQPDSAPLKQLFSQFESNVWFTKETKAMIKDAGIEGITKNIIVEALRLANRSINGENGQALSTYWDPVIKYATENENYLDSKKQLNELKTDKVLNEELKKLNFEMPKTVAQAAALAENLKALEDTATGNVAKFEDLSKATLNVITSLEKLSDAGKYITDFSKSISAWIKNIRATSMGSPETQLNMAKANFEEQLKLAKFGTTAEERRSAMSGITGYADTYMNAIKSYYATSEKGQKDMEDVISQVGDLGKTVDIQELQLGALNDIKDGIYDIPKGISDANKILFNDLVTQMNTAGESAKFNPTVENQLRYDALAKIVLMIDKSAKSGADAVFMDKLIASAAGKDSLKTNVNLIINSAEFDAAQKTAIIGNVLASFNEKRLVLNNFEFDVKDAIDAAKMQIAASMGGTYAPSENILPKKENYQLVTLSQADIDMLSKITAAPQSATQTANALPEITVMPQTPAKTVEGSSFLEGKASNLGYGGDYGDIQGMLNFIEYMQTNSYANGGIANQPSIFGEAGAEAAVPLPDGRSIPVKIINPSNDSNINTAETIAELKSQNQKLEVLVNTMMATSKAEREKTQELIDAMNGLRTDTRLKNKA